MTGSSAPAGWYPDPSGEPGERYFDGSNWTSTKRIVGDDERVEILNQALAAAVARGGQIESQTRFEAVICYRRRVNHKLHAILTVCTCLLWGIVWLAVSRPSGERRELLQVDSRGGVISSEPAQ